MFICWCAPAWKNGILLSAGVENQNQIKSNQIKSINQSINLFGVVMTFF